MLLLRAPATSISSVTSGTKLALSGTQDSRNPGFGIRVDRGQTVQLLSPAELRLVDMGDGQDPDLAVVLEHVDGAPVGEVRDGEPRDAVERRLGRLAERRGDDIVLAPREAMSSSRRRRSVTSWNVTTPATMFPSAS